MQKSLRLRGGFTLVELMTAISIIGILIALLIPAIAAAREAARRMDCSNRLKQISLAMCNYEAVHQRYPSCRRGSSFAEDPYARVGGLVSLLPYLEQSALHQKLQSSIVYNHPPSSSFRMMCPLPPNPNSKFQIEPWLDKVGLFRCPSDPKLETDTEMGFTNYAFSMGDTIIDNSKGVTRGMFAASVFKGLKDVIDGSSNTIVMSEIRVDGEMIEWLDDAVLTVPGNYSRTMGLREGLIPRIPPPAPEFFGRGRRWVDGAPIFSAFNTILPPGDVSANHRDSDDLTYGNFTAGSYHAGEGVNCAFGDGSIRFVGSNIDCGDLMQKAPIGNSSGNSPYGVWGSLGTISGSEISIDAL
jgi:prepilin-type N-terminal cleavage/methylation domain-containing protein